MPSQRREFGKVGAFQVLSALVDGTALFPLASNGKFSERGRSANYAFDRFGYLLDTRRFASEAPIAFDPELKSLTADVFLSVDRGASASHEPVVGTFNGTEYVFGTARFQTLCRVTQKPLPAARAFPILTGRWKLATYAHSYTDVSSLEQLLPALRATFAPQVATSLTLGSTLESEREPAPHSLTHSLTRCLTS